MRWFRLSAVIAVALQWSLPASACSIITQGMVFFAYGSSEVSSQARKMIELMGFGRAGQKFPTTCQSFHVIGHTDTAEAASLDVNLSVARAKAVGKVLEEQQRGRVVEISGRPDQLLLPTGHGVREAQNRFVTVIWTSARGRMRCDPATKNDQDVPRTTCGVPEYAACYLELEDGTVCNFGDVPNPNPTRYSVVRQ